MTKKIFWNIICIFLLLFPTALAACPSHPQGTIEDSESNDDWSMFRHDLQRTGFSSSNAPNTNNIRWAYQTEGPIIRSSPTVANGRVYVASYDMNLYCLDSLTGEKIWKFFLRDKWVYSSASVADGKVYIGGVDEESFSGLYCLNANNGTLIWNHAREGEGSMWASPLVVNGNVYVGTNCAQGGRLYCLNAENGTERWNYTSGILGDNILSSPAFFNESVYFGVMLDSGSGNVLRLNANTGEKIWNYTTVGFSDCAPAISNGKIYIGTMKYAASAGYVYCLNADTGHFIWSYRAYNYIQSSPAVAYGNVYIGSKDAFLHCLDAETGVEKWNFETGDAVHASPAVADGKVYLGSEDGYLYCLNAYNGSLIWDHVISYDESAPGPVESSPTICDGIVYVGGADGQVYAFQDTIEISSISGGFGLGATLTNVGNKPIIDLEWRLTAVNNGLLKINDIEKTGILPPLQPGENARIKLLIFGLGKMRITFSANPPGVTPMTKTVDGFLLGFFMFLKKT